MPPKHLLPFLLTLLFFPTLASAQTTDEDQLEKETIHKDSLESIAFLQKNNLNIRAFSKGGNETHFVCCYDFQVTKQNLNNETVYWIPTYFYAEDVDETTDIEAFLGTANENTFIDGLDDYGLIELAVAEPFRFHTSGDTLFQTVLKCHLSRDSIEYLYTLAGDDILTFAYCDSVLEAHSTPVHAVIFHKNLFKKKEKHTDPSGLTIHFGKSKTFNGVVYHRLYVDIPRPQGGYDPMEYVLDKNLNLINFENTPPEVCAWLIGEE
ncbi:MAG: hypothetical protein IT270_12800 [Saprospiraceae bacterium]|nr:hypothetical protein [Saprospiraceae bacterium]